MRDDQIDEDEDLSHQDDDPAPENKIASNPKRIAAITRATYQRKIDNLICAAQERMSVLKMEGDPSSRDLIDQLFVRALFLRIKSFQNERLILLRHIRATDQNPDILLMCDRVASLKMEAIENEGLETALRWGDRLKEVSPLSLAEIRADKKLLDDLTHRKTREIASVLRMMAATGPADLALAPATIKKVAAQVAGDVARTTLPADSAVIAQLAGVSRGLAPDARQNALQRKAQNRSRTLDEWIAVADHLAPDQSVDPKTLWRAPRDFGLIARTIWIAGLATGLRPIEWINAGVFIETPDAPDGDLPNVIDDPAEAARRRDQWVLIVQNAKRKVEMKTPVEMFRTIRIGGLDPATQDAIVAAAMATESEAAENEETWRLWMISTTKRITRVAAKAGFTASLSLYDARHYFAWRAKQALDDFEVAALMGHANIRSAGVYGARIKRPKRSEREIPIADLARLGIAAPSKQNVEFVYKRAAKMQGWDIDPSPPLSAPDAAEAVDAKEGSAKTQD